MPSQVLGTLFAAVSFSGANSLFKYIDITNYGKESHRHNIQMEKYARDHEAWSRENIMNEEKIRHLEMDKQEANVNLDITNKSLDFSKKNQKVILKREPQKSQYHQPSERMQKYKNVSSGMIGFGLAYGGTKLLDLLL